MQRALRGRGYLPIFSRILLEKVGGTYLSLCNKNSDLIFLENFTRKGGRGYLSIFSRILLEKVGGTYLSRIFLRSLCIPMVQKNRTQTTYRGPPLYLHIECVVASAHCALLLKNFMALRMSSCWSRYANCVPSYYVDARQILRRRRRCLLQMHLCRPPRGCLRTHFGEICSS